MILNTPIQASGLMAAIKSIEIGIGHELGDHIGFVYTHPLSKGSSSSAHYAGNAQTHMNVGLAMGDAMVDLIKNSLLKSD